MKQKLLALLILLFTGPLTFGHSYHEDSFKDIQVKAACYTQMIQRYPDLFEEKKNIFGQSQGDYQNKYRAYVFPNGDGSYNLETSTYLCNTQMQNDRAVVKEIINLEDFIPALNSYLQEKGLFEQDEFFVLGDQIHFSFNRAAPGTYSVSIGLPTDDACATTVVMKNKDEVIPELSRNDWECVGIPD